MGFGGFFVCLVGLVLVCCIFLRANQVFLQKQDLSFRKLGGGCFYLWGFRFCEVFVFVGFFSCCGFLGAHFSGHMDGMIVEDLQDSNFSIS